MKTQTRYGTKTGTPPVTPPETPPVTPPEGALDLKEVEAMVTKILAATLAAELPKAQIDAATITKAVTDGLAKAAPAGEKALTRAEIPALVAEAVKALNLGTREVKATANTADANREQVEVPTCWRKGNLPIHGKQLLNILTGKHQDTGITESVLGKAVETSERNWDRMRTKAMTSTGSNTGDEFVPSDLSGELQRRMYLSSLVYQKMGASEILMPTQPYTFPLSTTRPTFYLEATENTATTATDSGTGNVILNARKFMAKVLFSYELDEDSIIPLLPLLQAQLGEAAAATFESCIINGDTTATHMDTDTETVAKHSDRAFKGFRKLALAVTELKADLSTGGITAANWRSLKKKMGKYGVNIADLLTICGVAGENDFIGLTEVVTADKAGANATILTGKLPSIHGVPIITSAWCREDLNASGVDDGVTATKGSIILVNTKQFILGRRREFVVETDRDINTQQTAVVASFRKTMSPIETPSATVPSVVIGYNYTA